jgi:hypothetical protein
MRLDESEVRVPLVVQPVEVAWWKKMKSATMVLFWKRSDMPTQLSLMEVTNVDGDEQEFTGWYYIHRMHCAVYRYDRPLVDMKYGAE